MDFKGNWSYFYNKVLSVIFTVSLLIVIAFIFPKESQWNMLILLIIFFGQGHFIISYVYQFSSLERKIPSRKKRSLFVGIILFSVIVLAFLYFGMSMNEWSLVFIGAYFIAHNTLNEQTMWQQASGSKKANYLLVFSILCIAFGSYFVSTTSDSFSFAISKRLITLDDIYLNQDLLPLPFQDQSHLVPLLLPIVAYALGCALFLFLWMKKQLTYAQIKLWSFAVAAIILLSITKIALDFLYLMAFIIIYHYITWFIFYLGKTSQQGPLLLTRRFYLKINAIIYVVLIAVFLLGNFIDSFITHYAYGIFFSVNYFVLWTFLHISSTMINETPIQEWISRK